MHLELPPELGANCGKRRILLQVWGLAVLLAEQHLVVDEVEETGRVGTKGIVPLQVVLGRHASPAASKSVAPPADTLIRWGAVGVSSPAVGGPAGPGRGGSFMPSSARAGNG
jgi:hypothetical protein